MTVPSPDSREPLLLGASSVPFPQTESLGEKPLGGKGKVFHFSCLSVQGAVLIIPLLSPASVQNQDSTEGLFPEQIIFILVS